MVVSNLEDPQICSNKNYYEDYSDKELIDAFVHNKEELAFNEIFNRYYNKVKGLSLKMLKDPSEAEDITQEVFIKLLNCAHSFRGEAKFSTWLYAVTTNTIRMRFRKLNKNRGSISLDDENYSGSLDIAISKARSNSKNPESISINRELVEKLYEALNDLPEISKEVILLRGREQYTNHKISKKMNMTLPAIKSRVFRAKQHLNKNFYFA